LAELQVDPDALRGCLAPLVSEVEERLGHPSREVEADEIRGPLQLLARRSLPRPVTPGVHELIEELSIG